MSFSFKFVWNVFLSLDVVFLSVSHVVPGKELLQKNTLLSSFLNMWHTHTHTLSVGAINGTAEIHYTKNKCLWVINYELSKDEDNPTKLGIWSKGLFLNLESWNKSIINALQTQSQFQMVHKIIILSTYYQILRQHGMYHSWRKQSHDAVQWRNSSNNFIQSKKRKMD